MSVSYDRCCIPHSLCTPQVWNERRRVEPADEPFFAREDYAAIEAEIRAGLNAFINQLGGR